MEDKKSEIVRASAIFLLFLGVVAGCWFLSTEYAKALDAKFDQTVTYTINPNGDKSGDGAMYGINNLKLNQEEGYYTWKEYLTFNGSVDKTVDTKYDTTSEVTVVKDLKEADAEPLVEHQIVYKLNREAIANNKENHHQDTVCVKGGEARESYVYPICKSGWNTESARFVKHHYIIHLPENSDPANYR